MNALSKLLILGLVLTGAGCGGHDHDDHDHDDGGVVVEPPPATTDAEYDWNLPKGFPRPREFADNPLSEAKVELGRHLFYDLRLSVNQTIACASCHQPALAFTDGQTTSTGTLGDAHPRNAQALVNVVYNSTFNWANPTILTAHDQALIPLLNEFPVELGWSGHEAEILARLAADSLYRELFADAFPDEAEPISVEGVVKGVGAFVSVLISGNSPYDKAVYQGQPGALTAAARRGEALFFSERLECFHCHGGFNFSQSVDHEGSAFTQAEFHNNGLYNIGGQGDYPANNTGLWEFTQRPADMGRFRPPTLRNIALTAPYMHDGSIATLEEVLDHYARGGRLIETGPRAGDGAISPHKSELLVGFSLNEREKRDLLVFFDSLTDWDFLCDSRFADPFGNFPQHDNCY